MGALFLGVDIGGTVAKAALFDDRGRQVAVAAEERSGIFPRPGYAERRTEEAWSAAVDAIRRVLAMPGVESGRIAAMCVTGHGNGVYLVAADGTPVGNGILSVDARAAALVAEMQRDGRAAALERLTGKRVYAGLTSLVMGWISANDPERARAAAHALLLKDYIRWRLTGRLATDPNDASGSGLMNLATGAYDPAIWQILGDPSWLAKLPPEMLPGSAEAGRVTAAAAAATGLPAGLPVATGTMDIEAIRLASGVLDPSCFMVSAGTWSVNLTVTDRPIAGAAMPSFQGIADDGRRFFVAEATPTGATNLAWFRREILGTGEGGPDFAEINAMVAGLEADASEVVYLPFLHGGAGEPKAAFVGVTGDCGRAHLLRAIYEGIAFDHRTHVDALARALGQRPAIARFSGGAARSAVWAQLVADVLALPVETLAAEELGALGAAMMAAMAVGRFASPREAVAAMVAIRDRYEPETERSRILAEKFTRYCATREALAPLWRRFGA